AIALEGRVERAEPERETKRVGGAAGARDGGAGAETTAVDAALGGARAKRGEVGERIGAALGAEHEVGGGESAVGSATRDGAPPPVALEDAPISRRPLVRIVRDPGGERVRQHAFERLALGGGPIAEVLEPALHRGECGPEQLGDLGGSREEQ